MSIERRGKESGSHLACRIPLPEKAARKPSSLSVQDSTSTRDTSVKPNECPPNPKSSASNARNRDVW